MTIGFDRKYLPLAMVLLMGIAALIALSLQALGQLRSDVEDFDRSREVQTKVQRIYVTLLDLESSERGYLLTLERVYLEPYRAGKARLDAELADLSALPRHCRSRPRIGSPETFGLHGMAERVRAVGGTLRLRSIHGARTTFEAAIPVDGPAKKASN